MHDGRGEGLRLAAGWLILGCMSLFILGELWDIQWHADVGPDTFWTKSHLLFYLGMSLTGLTNLYVVLRTSRAVGTNRPARAGTALWRRLFQAPRGFVICGLGALSFLLMGLYDLWWHEMFGFDITLFSPPHFGLLFSAVVSLVGLLYIFAGQVHRPPAAGDLALAAPASAFAPATLGFLAAAALLMTEFSTFLLVAIDQFDLVGPVITYGVAVALVFGLMLMAVASFLRLPGAATATSLLYLLCRTAAWYAVPALVAWEARWEGLAYRSEAPGVALVPFVSPPYLFVAGLVIDLALLAARRLRPGGRPFVWVTAALALVAHLLVDRRWLVWMGFWQQRHPERASLFAEVFDRYAAAYLPTLLAAALAADLAGWLGWNWGVALRYAEATQGSAAPRPGQPAWRWAGLLLLALALVLPSWPARPAAAHASKEQAVVHTETLKVDPYPVAVEFTDWPLRENKNFQAVIHVEGGIQGLKPYLRITPGPWVKGPRREFRPDVYPGVDDAWTVFGLGIYGTGRWYWDLTIDGPEGQGTGRLTLRVEEAPPFPLWLGWALGLAPLWGLCGFAVAEARRVRRLVAQGAGTRL